MYGFFEFIAYVALVFLAIWFLGMNLFKYSGKFFSFLTLYRYKNTLKSYAHHKEDFYENYKEVFGVVDIDYVIKRQEQIRKSLSTLTPKGYVSVSLTALELLFLLEELEGTIEELDDGTYRISKEQLTQLFLVNVDKLVYVKRLKEIIKTFIPKEGEEISLDAADLFEQIRKGRFSKEEGNSLFSMQVDNSQQFIGTLKQNLYEEMHLVTVEDGVKEKIPNSTLQPKLKKDEYVEGKQVIWSDGTLRTKMGKTVVIQHTNGSVEKTDLQGNKVEENKKKNGKKSSSPTQLEKPVKKILDNSMKETEEPMAFTSKRSKRVKKKSSLVEK